jgi:hypothetical protein
MPRPQRRDPCVPTILFDFRKKLGNFEMISIDVIAYKFYLRRGRVVATWNVGVDAI